MKILEEVLEKFGESPFTMGDLVQNTGVEALNRGAVLYNRSKNPKLFKLSSRIILSVENQFTAVNVMIPESMSGGIRQGMMVSGKSFSHYWEDCGIINFKMALVEHHGTLGLELQPWSDENAFSIVPGYRPKLVDSYSSSPVASHGRVSMHSEQTKDILCYYCGDTDPHWGIRHIPQSGPIKSGSMEFQSVTELSVHIAKSAKYMVWHGQLARPSFENRASMLLDVLEPLAEFRQEELDINIYSEQIEKQRLLWYPDGTVEVETTRKETKQTAVKQTTVTQKKRYV